MKHFCRFKSLVKCLFMLGIFIGAGCSKNEEAVITPAQAGMSLKAGSTSVMLETFTLTTTKWTDISAGAPYWAAAGFTLIWFPPCSYSADTYGYLPTQWYNYNNSRGTQAQLTAAITAVKNNGMTAIADIVLNHRNGNATAGADFVNPAFSNNAAAVTKTDECGCGTGAADTGNDFNGGRDLDHTNTNVQSLCKAYVASQMALGFGGGRYDMTIGYGGTYAAMYKTSGFNVGEYWVQDRNTINSWISKSGMNAFDFPTLYALQSAIQGNNYTALSGLPGLIGINPSHAVTMAGNHDWASVGLLGEVYVLTHPGIPQVPIGDWNSYSSQISTLIALRKSAGIGQTSTVSQQAATTTVYAAIIDGKLAMKIGPGSWSPSGSGWTLKTSGTNYAVWTNF